VGLGVPTQHRQTNTVERCFFRVVEPES